MNDEILIKVATDLSDLKPEFRDMSELWKKHNTEVEQGRKAINDYKEAQLRDNRKIQDAIKSRVEAVGAQGKAYQELEKKLESVNKKNSKSFDTKKIDDFNKTLKEASKKINDFDSFELDVDDIDDLTSQLSTVEDDFEALNVLVDFFEKKMKGAASGAVDSFEVLKQKIEETKLNISSTENFIKEIDKKIDNTAPGRAQANLIAERNAAKQALKEETVALADYNAQIKKSREENVSLTTQLRKVKDELVKLEIEGGRGSERYKQLQEEAEKYNDVIKETNRELNRQSSATEGLDNLIGAATGLVGVFSAAEGASALFGDENEDLEESLVKLNGAIALLNGLQAIQLELSKKETIAGRSLAFVRGQYAIATDASASATVRLGAATKALGIGLLVGALAAIVVYWEDIAKFIGLTSDSTERLNDINTKSNEIYGDQIATLSLLVDSVRDGELSINQKNDAVKDYNETFGKTFGIVSSYAELERKLIEQGDDYIRFLGLKAKAEAAYQLAVEKSKEALLKRSDQETSILDIGRFRLNGNPLNPSNFESVSPQEVARKRNDGLADELELESDAFLEQQKKLEAEMESLAKQLGISLTEVNQDVIKEYEKLSEVLVSLLRRQEDIRLNSIENARDREVALLERSLEDEKKIYLEQIKELKVSEEKKAQLRAEFNKLYNEETGIAYEELRKNIQKIDDKYAKELEQVQFSALQAIDSILLGDEERQRQAIADKWDSIRAEIEEQIKKTNDEFKKEGLKVILDEIDVAEDEETSAFDLNVGLDRVDREKEISESILRIYQANNDEIIRSEEIKQRQLLQLEQAYLKNLLTVYRDSLESDDQKGLYDGLIDQLKSSTDISEIEDVASKLKEALGEDAAKEILKTVDALNEVSESIEGISEKSNFQKLVDDIGAWTSSVESFSLKLAESLGLNGQAAQEFAQGVSTAIYSTFESLNTIFQAEIDQHRQRVDVLQDSIDAIEDEVERERRLFEEGYANNYQTRQEDIENLKAQKREEEEELKKAQKRKAQLAKAEFLIDTVSQLSNLITAASNIFKWASKIPVVGVPIAIGLIGTMFGAFAIAKVKAAQAIGSTQTFRTGLKKGALSLSGPTHEEKGFGLYNSKTGDRVAEFEDGEDVLVVNRAQKKKYRHVIDALINDAMGKMSFEDSLDRHYVTKNGKNSMSIIRNINNVTVIAEKSREKASKESIEMLAEIKDFKKKFSEEFTGHRDERDNKIEAWETPKNYYVKKGNVIKKYAKDGD